MYIEWPEGIVDLVIISKEFLEEYLIFIRKAIYGNFDADLLCLRLLDKYLVNECNLKMIKADSCIFFGKDEKGKLETAMSVYVDNLFMSSNPGTSKNIKEKIKEKFNISESVKVKIVLGVYYEWGRDAKYTYLKNDHGQRFEEAHRSLKEGYWE